MLKRQVCRFSPWNLLLTVVVLACVVYYYLLYASKDDEEDDSSISSISSSSSNNRMSDTLAKLKPSSPAGAAKRFFHRTGDVNVLILFTKAKGNENMKKKLRVCVRSMLNYTSVPVKLHIIGDDISQKVARHVIAQIAKKATSFFSVKFHNVKEISDILHKTVSNMQRHFSYKPGTYYSDAIFFLSMALHQVFAESKIVMIDIDVQFEVDIEELYQEFRKFSDDAVIGIAYEQQPVYRHVFQLYRLNHSEPKIGEPPALGFPGFNSGVVLLDLEKMRKSDMYNHFLSDAVVDELVQKYHFHGHLGDQDFFTLVATEHKELFHILSCGWNRQLCQWWRNHGYEHIFDEFYECKGDIKIHHGNCNTPIIL